MLADLLLVSARAALRRPGFALIVALIAALGLGLATTAGNLVHTIFVRALPFAQAERLHVFSSTNPPEGWWEAPGAPAEFRHFAREARLDDGLALFFDQLSLTVTPAAAGQPAERVPVSYVEHNFFPLLGIAPALGRTFVTEETADGSDHRVVVVSHRFWQAKLGGRADVIGTELRLNDRPHEIVGVMPAGFRDVSLESGDPEVWLPFPLAAGALGSGLYSDYTLRRCRALLRLADGAATGSAQQEADAIARQLNTDRRDDMQGRGFLVQPLRHYYFWRVQPAVAALGAGSLLVLLVAIVNLVNLLLVESVRRGPELAVRAALGAEARSLAAALAATALVPLLAGGALAVLVAAGLMAWLREASFLVLPAFVRLELSGAGLAGGLGLLLGVAALVVLVPPHRARRVDLRAALAAEGKGTASAGGARSRHALVLAEVALATALLVGTGLAGRSLWELIHRPVGYRAQQLLTMTTEIDRTRHATPDARAELTRQINAAIQDIPGTQGATVWSGGMLGLGWWVTSLTPAHLDVSDPQNARTFQRNGAVPGGLGVLGIPLVRGRDFSPTAVRGQPIEIIIDERVATTLWPGEDALGKTVVSNRNAALLAVVVGLAAPVRHRGLTFDESRNTGDAYINAFQVPMDQVNLMFRITPGQERTVVEHARQALARLDPTMAIEDVRWMEQRLAAEADVPRFTAMALGMFATVSVLLTAIGVYGVLAFATAQRTREFGVRLALGAAPGRVMGQVLAGGGRWIAAGIATGLVIALFTAPLLGNLLHGVSPRDPLVLTGAAVVVALVGLAGAALPAWRASRVDPLVALRAD